MASKISITLVGSHTHVTEKNDTHTELLDSDNGHRCKTSTHFSKVHLQAASHTVKTATLADSLLAGFATDHFNYETVILIVF